MQAPDARPVAAAGVAAFRGEDLLLIRRANPPLQGQWSLPGGRIEFGERAEAAAIREAREETGCRVELLGLIDVVQFIEPDRHLLLIDYAARWVCGEPRPGGDALDARFFPPDELGGLNLWSETRRIIGAGRERLKAEAAPAAAAIGRETR